MTWISRRMAQKPNRVQTAIEVAYDLTRKTITGDNLDAKMAAKWFPFLATVFFFIWFSNMIGFIPLPTNTENEISVFGVQIPSFAIYAATANISIPLALTLFVWVSYHVEGIRTKGLIAYFRSWLPAGLEDMNPIGKAFIFVIEAISHFARLISLSVRLFANILAGHLLLLFMGGGLAVLLGIAALGALTFPMAFFFFILEVGLIATLQAFIFATLTAIYLGGATAENHSCTRKGAAQMDLISAAASGVTDTGVTAAGKAIALGVGAGLGSIGAGIGIGIIFGKEIESVARQPEMKDELQQIRWLGFALTEAVAFYTFIFGLIAFFL
jgi:F-type H+-transporting ATPase subunit a